MSDKYEVGDRVRITADKPSYTDLRLGDVVTVVDFRTRVESDGLVVPLLFVETYLGRRMVEAEEVELALDFPRADPPPDRKVVIRAAEPDEIVDEIFEKIMRSDIELYSVVFHANEKLPLERIEPQPQPEPVEEGLTPEQEAVVGHAAQRLAEAQEASEPQRVAPGKVRMPTGPEDVLGLRDYADEEMSVAYVEYVDDLKGREPWFIFEIQGAQVDIPADGVAAFVGWLLNRIRHSRRPE